jgi:hypothetical protein
VMALTVASGRYLLRWVGGVARTVALAGRIALGMLGVVSLKLLPLKEVGRAVRVAARMALGMLEAASLKLLLRWVGRVARVVPVVMAAARMELGMQGVVSLKLLLLRFVGRAAMTATVALTLPTSAPVASTVEARRLPNPLSAAWVDGDD